MRSEKAFTKAEAKGRPYRRRVDVYVNSWQLDLSLGLRCLWPRADKEESPMNAALIVLVIVLFAVLAIREAKLTTEALKANGSG